MATGRIFGLGLSRTGTTSLHAAGVILGFSAVHYPGPLATRWMAGNFADETLGPFAFWTDLPVPVYFREFDRTCPGSRFIMTVREPEVWVESVERWFARTPPSSEKTLQRDLVRLICYGVFSFHRQRFLDVYKRHTDQVMEYFRDRPIDLLVLDLTKETDPWGRLCPFLDRPVPETKFPHMSSPSIGDLRMVLPQEVADKRRRIGEFIS
jgi:Sulfotransferase domain